MLKVLSLLLRPVRTNCVFLLSKHSQCQTPTSNRESTNLVERTKMRVATPSEGNTKVKEESRIYIGYQDPSHSFSSLILKIITCFDFKIQSQPEA